MKFKEIETKYRATEFTLKQFSACCEGLNPSKRLNVGSFDHYYLRDDGAALRYREGNKSELTVKQKSKDANNFIRTEVNLGLTPDQSLEKLTAFANLLGYQHNFTIYKTCVIFFWENYNIVYYVVYDENLKERDRFVEIELSEEHDWGTEAEAWTFLQSLEKALLPLDISPAKRIRRSLFEMFKK